MSIHEAALEGFGRGASAYERGRPSYPQPAVDWMLERLSIGPGRVVADLGAGTGKFTRLLVASGARVLAVEPVAGMRAELRRAVPAAEVVDATAQAIPVQDGELDAVTAAHNLGAAFLDEVGTAIRSLRSPGPECTAAIGVPTELGVKRKLVKPAPDRLFAMNVELDEPLVDAAGDRELAVDAVGVALTGHRPAGQVRQREFHPSLAWRAAPDADQVARVECEVQERGQVAEELDRQVLGLVDDQELLRLGFRMILDAEPGIEVVGEADDGAAAIRRVTELRPDVVLMDVRMPGMDGIAATEAIVAAGLASKVLILTTFDLDQYVYAGLRAGASGFLLKDVPPTELISAIRSVASGEAVIAPGATRRLLDSFTALLPNPDQEQRKQELLSSLTEREREVFFKVAAGASNAEVAAGLHMSEGTVKVHVGRILAKFNLRDRVQIVVLGYESGLIIPSG